MLFLTSWRDECLLHSNELRDGRRGEASKLQGEAGRGDRVSGYACMSLDPRAEQAGEEMHRERERERERESIGTRHPLRRQLD